MHVSTSRSPTARERIYCGSILQDGTFRRARGCTENALNALRAFGENPLQIARAHGLATGWCCFCRRQLTDGRSVAMGYGPICAERYGLEWGEQRARSVVELDPATREQRAREAEADRADAAIARVLSDDDLIAQGERDEARRAAESDALLHDAILQQESEAAHRAFGSEEEEENAVIEAEELAAAAAAPARIVPAAARTAVIGQGVQRRRIVIRPVLPQDDEDRHFM